MSNIELNMLPPKTDIETKSVLKNLIQSHRFLAELKGISKSIPNQKILINILPLLEAKDSSAVENIITSHDEIYKQTLFADFLSNPSAKEVQNYAVALKAGYEELIRNNILSNRIILNIQEIIAANNAGFRKQPGTELKNINTGKTVYVPPQTYNEISMLMGNLEQYINDDSIHKVDPLIKMAVIHYQFESIHPFYDGNGRSGRILNILYLVYKGLLDIPVLYLSSYIIHHKTDYYRLLQEVREKENWEEWILFMLKGIEKTSQKTIELINAIKLIMQDYKNRIRSQYKFYSQDLLNNLFNHPYTKIEFLERDLNIHRQTASSYLEQLADGKFLKVAKIGTHKYFINQPLLRLFKEFEL